MRDLSIIIATLSLFFSLQHVAICAQIYTPPDNIALDCGSSTSGNSAVPGGRKWTGDKDSKVALIEESSSKSVSATALSQSSSILRVPYLTARISISQFTYVFPVTAGQKFIRLHFYPAQYQGFDRSKNFFSVKVGSYSLLNNFSASLTAQYLGEASFFKEFCVNLEQNQSLTVTFTPSMSMSYAFINGIEVVSMPTNLYYSRLDDQGLPFIGQEAQFQINNYTALENVHRLNIGGNSIPAVNDTGMYRNWYDDYFYLVPAGVVASNTSIKLDYSIIPQYTAPDDVYRTARSMGSNRTENLLYNLTWRLPVDSGFRYLVRLHFCEFDPYVETVSDRRFSIYIDNKTAEAAFDVMEASGGKGRPMYKDYVVMIGNTGDKSEYTLFIALHPKNLFSAYADGFLNGLEVFKLNNSGGNLAGPNPAPQAPPAGNEESSPKAKKSNTKRKLLFSIGGCGIGLLIILVLLCCIIVWRHRKMHWYGAYCKGSRFCCWMDPYKRKSFWAKSSSLPDELCRHFSLDEIKAATSDFHEALIIGVGGFGNVYKGFLDNGETIAAIKRLNPLSRQGAREFKTEIEMLSQLRHIHLVSLIGYCNDNSEMILVYDYMINGTLRDHLYDTKNDPLTWKQRLKICHGAAIGLNYLHTEVKYTIIHRDVKTSNILLDEKFSAKVSDFGLSKMDPKIDVVNTGVKGTWGYLDPEYARGHALTEKSDVYSFGVVLFEVLCARKALDQKLAVDQVNLAHWVKKCIADGTLYQIIDPRLRGKISPECFKVFVEIAESCIQEAGVNRPLMNDVMEKLGFALELQETADAGKEKINPAGEHSYQDILFPLARDIDVDTLGSNVIAAPNPVHDSGSSLSYDIFSSTISPKEL
ncbi:PREDICTED: receptor-like protein kinase FERONIA [Theobroma cacao]|uniref:Receptor-like protein kinase FERONIA n=1 Tax=Theobroma cacao TaxID=3641 RepID=A0AB32WAH2_THECC|nr:PREDICTED: receptor-like protein kinase FERONIA [Theobroma cacao]